MYRDDYEAFGFSRGNEEITQLGDDHEGLIVPGSISMWAKKPARPRQMGGFMPKGSAQQMG